MPSARSTLPPCADPCAATGPGRCGTKPNSALPLSHRRNAYTREPGPARIMQNLIWETENMSQFNTDGRSATGRKLFKDKPAKTAKPARKPMPEIQLGEHGRYQIKSGRLAGEYVARAFPKPPTKAKGLIAEATGATEEAAIEALHALIDSRETRRIDSRRKVADTRPAIPTVEEFVEAIGQVALTRPQRAMLLALSLAGDDGLSEQKMASAAGYKSQASANRAFLAAGLLIANYLSVQEEAKTSPDEADVPTLLGYRGQPKNDEDPGNWILHQEVREAVRTAL